MSLRLSNEPILRADSSLQVREMMRNNGLTDALQADITELAVNRPGSYWVEDTQGWRCIDNPALTLSHLLGLATAIGVLNKKPLNQDSPIASLTLPDGERCQIVLPPVCENGTVSMTIRQPSASRFTLADYEQSGRLRPTLSAASDDLQPWELVMLALAKKGDFKRFLSWL